MQSRNKFNSLHFLKYTSVAACFLLLSVLLLSCDPGNKNEKPAGTSPKTVDLPAQSLSAKYQFGADERTIDFGTQPLAVPTGTMAEVMLRDQVLKSLLADAGFTLQVHSFAKGKDINFFMERGDLELAVAGDMPVVSAAAADYGVAIALVKKNFSSIITDKVVKLADLRGKRVGYAPGSSAHYLLMASLKTVNLTEKDIIMVPLNINELIDALEQGEIDAFAAWEPTPTIALKKSTKFKVLHRGITSSYLYCSKSFFERNPATVKQLIASITRSMRWMTLSQENILLATDWSMNAANNFSGKKSVLTRQEYAGLINDGIIDIASSPIIPMSVLMDGGQIQNEFLFLQQAGKIAPEITWPMTLKNFDRSMMVEVLNNPVQFRLSEYNF